MGKRAALVLVLFFLSASCLITPLPVKAESRTLIVPDDYSTIQSAIKNAAAGDIVFVKKGTYNVSSVLLNFTVRRNCIAYHVQPRRRRKLHNRWKHNPDWRSKRRP